MIQSRDKEFTLSTFKTLYECVKSFKRDTFHKSCWILVSDEHTCLIKSFPACTNVELRDITACKWEKNSQSHHDLHLDPTMSNIELVQEIFI